jgi:hypothetical protein
VLSIPLILALLPAAATTASGVTAPVESEQAWLRPWLVSLQSSARAAVSGLELVPPASVASEIDARLTDPRFVALARDASRVFAEHGAEIHDHWPSYQDEVARAAARLRTRFPSAASDIAAALAATRDWEWALLDAEREHGLLSAGRSKLAEGGDVLALLLRDFDGPASVRDELRAGLRGTIAGAVLADVAERGVAVDAERVERLAAIWHAGASSYARLLISKLGFDFPGLPSRLGLERYVDVDTIDALTAWRGAPADPTLGVFADCAEDVDEVSAYVARARRTDALREPDA